MDSKSWYLSRTIWAGIVMILATILKLAGHELPSELQGPMVDQLILGAQVVSGFIAIYGRMKATKQISGKQGQQ